MAFSGLEGMGRPEIPIEDLARINNEMMNLNRELQRDRAQLARQERFVSKLVATVPAYIYVCELPMLRATFINDAVARLAGVSASSTLDSTALRRLNLEPRGAGGHVLGVPSLTALADDALLEWEADLSGAAGEPLWVQSRAAVLERDGEGQVSSILVIAVDATARRSAEMQLEKLATHDALTGLLNRAGLDLRAGVLVERAKRDDTELGVAFFDLDQLKETNDTLGHAAGDSLLVAAANALQTMVRASDVVARVGGDEFVVVVGNASDDGMRELVERIRQAAAAGDGSTSGAPTPELSAGWITRQIGAGDSLGDLLDRADKEMYLDKYARRERRNA